MNLRDRLIEAVSAYCAAEGITPSTLSNRILNDGKRIPAIIAPNGDCSTRVFEKIMQHIGALPKPPRSHTKPRPLVSKSGK